MLICKLHTCLYWKSVRYTNIHMEQNSDRSDYRWCHERYSKLGTYRGAAILEWLEWNIFALTALCGTGGDREGLIHLMFVTILDPDWTKYMLPITINMSSITDRLRRNFGAASSITPCAELSAHDEERSFRAWWGTRKFRRITTRRYLN